MRSYGGLKSQDVKKIFAFFGKATLYRKTFKIVFRMDSSRHRSAYVLCSNFKKFGRRETGKVVRYLPDKKQNFAWFSSFRQLSDRAQN